MAIRTPFVAGKFYDGDANNLCNYVQSTLSATQENKANVTDKQLARLVVLPHAGHFFCGHIIAKALNQVELSNTLILLGPNHTGMGQALAVWGEGSWQTPLGQIPVNKEISQKILQCDAGFVQDTKAHEQEHSLEVILPFLQIKMQNLDIVPIAIAGRDLGHLQRAGYGLGKIIHELEVTGKNITIIVSSDMHHFSDHETTLALDKLALEALMEFNPLKLAQVINEHKISMCGVCPAIVALYALQKLETSNKFNLVQHTTSFEKSHDASSVVGYASLYVNKSTCKK